MTQVKSLEINKREILFKYINGQWWIALKPICEALGVNYDRALQNVKSDEILKDVYAKQHMRDTLNRTQEMVSLPERYIYGWIFSLQSKSEVLIAYKKECYDILYDYFHNKLVERAASLKEKTKKELELEELEKKLAQTEEFKEITKLKSEIKSEKKTLDNLDKEFVKENFDLWTQDFVSKESQL